MLELFVALIMLAALTLADQRALLWVMQQWNAFQQRFEEM